jgi:hypothetical protein
MSSKSDQSAHLQRRISVLEEANRRLVAGAAALQAVALKYGQHISGCSVAPCSCEWEETRSTMTGGAASLESKKLVTP